MKVSHHKVPEIQDISEHKKSRWRPNRLDNLCQVSQKHLELLIALSKPDHHTFSFPVYLPHDSDLCTSLVEGSRALINANGVDPQRMSFARAPKATHGGLAIWGDMQGAAIALDGLGRRLGAPRVRQGCVACFGGIERDFGEATSEGRCHIWRWL